MRRYICLSFFLMLIAGGAAAQIAVLKDINKGTTGSSPDLKAGVELNGYRYFAATDAEHGRELWRTDGTPAGTTLFKDINPGTGSSTPSQFFFGDSVFYFTALDGTTGTPRQVWRSNGTAAGTVQYTAFELGNGGAGMSIITLMDSLLFENGASATLGTELYKTNVLTGQTSLVLDINASGSSNPGAAGSAVMGGKLYFSALSSATVGTELWATDGTAAGTVLVKDIDATSGGSGLANSGSFRWWTKGAYIFFGASDGTTGINAHGFELFRSDGTAAGTQLVFDFSTGGGAGYHGIVGVVGDSLVVNGSSGSKTETFITQGTGISNSLNSVSVLLYSGNTTLGGSNPGLNGLTIGHTLYFSADGGSGQELYSTDGKTATQVKNINTFGVNGGNPSGLTAAFGKVFFGADPTVTYTNGELWASDGTAAGTVQVQDLVPNGSSSPQLMAVLGSRLLFTATTPATGAELFAYDPTALTVGPVSGAPFYKGQAISVPFSANGGVSTSGNVYTAELSDAGGSFASPVTIGTLSSTASTGSISATIPFGTPLGAGYRIRVAASSPALTSFDNGIDLAVATPQGALNFDGTNDYVNVPSGTFTSYTVEAWVKLTSTPLTSRNIAVFTSASGPGVDWSHQMYINSSGHFAHYTYDGTGHTVTGTTTVALNQWYHVAITASNGGQMHLYVNGVEEGTPVTVGTLWASGDRFRLGQAASLAGWMKGSIDELRIWNRALCGAEIQNNMNCELSNGQTGLTAYYRFNQGVLGGSNGTITTLTDSSGNGADGTLSGFAMSGATSNFVAGTLSGTSCPSFVPPPIGYTAFSTLYVSGPTDFGAYCNAIAHIEPAGTSPLSGLVMAAATLDGSVQNYLGAPYVTRHYDIEPASSASTATATLVLYFTQAEFNAFNSAAAITGYGFLPTGATDLPGKLRLRIRQYHGVPSGGNAPANYPATWGGSGPAQVDITPGADSITWNADAARWELTFRATGFSGFFVSTNSNNPLPLHLLSFTAQQADAGRNKLAWATATEGAGTHFIIERSSDGRDFVAIGRMNGEGRGASYNFYDAAFAEALNYYRIRLEDAAGNAVYSNIAAVHNGRGSGLSVYPIPAGETLLINSNNAALNGTTATIASADGRELINFRMDSRLQLSLSALPAGTYILKFADGTVIRLPKL